MSLRLYVLYVHLADHLMSVIVKFSFPAKQKKELVLEKSQEIKEQNAVIAHEKKEAEEALTEALPALEAARIALRDLEKSDVTEIRSVSWLWPSTCLWYLY